MSTAILVIDNELRTIKIPSEIQHLGTEGDESVKYLKFQMPRMYSGIDLSEFEARVNYINAEGKSDSAKTKNKNVTADSITFEWEVGGFATTKAGDVEFGVCLQKKNIEGIVVKDFNTTPASLPVLKGMRTEEHIKQEYPDYIDLIKKDIVGRFTGRVDPSLTKSGEAADSAVVGKLLDEIDANVAVELYNMFALLNRKASSISLATERERINQIIKNGSKPGADGELIDIRVGADGYVFDTAGEAVRGQFAEVRRTIYDEGLFHFTDIEAGNGYLDKNHKFFADTTWFTSDYIPVSEYSTIEYALEEYATLPHLVFYDSNRNMLSSVVGLVSGKLIHNTVTAPENTAYIRYVMYIKEGETRLEGQYVHVANDLVAVTQRKLQLLNDTLFNNRTILYDAETETNGYIRNNNVFVVDANWYSSDYIEINEYDIIDFDLMGHTIVSSLTIYDESKNVLRNIVGPANNVILKGHVVAPQGSKYFRYVMGHMGLESEPTQKVIVTSYNVLRSMSGEHTIADIEDNFISPRCIYTVCNDIGSEKGHNRNYSASLYLDHHFNNLSKEYPLRYVNGKDKKVFFSPIQVEDSNETNPAITTNGGVKLLETMKNVGILYNDTGFKNFDIIHRSILNSATIGVKPKVLCIGDSITYGELATMPDDDFESNYAYHLMTAEMFKKDAIDNGGGSECLFLGTMQKTRKMNYGGAEYDIITHHEGRRGWSYSTYMGADSPFYDSENNMFSIKKWLNDYRTMDDNGNRLDVGNGTGYKITADNINTIDVCLPTHIVIMLGTNGGQTTEQYLKMVNDIKAEYPDMIIALTVSDSAGTYFPSMHKNIGDELTFWNDSKDGTQAGRHNTMFTCMKNIIDEFDTEAYENNNVYVLPFYFVQPTAESCSMRKVDSPACEFELFKDTEKYITKYGWCPTTHINGAGHVTWAYQLYSWLKYTIAKSL